LRLGMLRAIFEANREGVLKVLKYFVLCTGALCRALITGRN
jgi:hypothetical protein